MTADIIPHPALQLAAQAIERAADICAAHQIKPSQHNGILYLVDNADSYMRCGMTVRAEDCVKNAITVLKPIQRTAPHLSKIYSELEDAAKQMRCYFTGANL